MRFVGLFAVIVGAINILMAILIVVAIYRDRIPADWKAKTAEYMEKAREKLPPDVKKQAEQYSLDKLPANNHLWGIAINAAVIGLFYVLMGHWTRSAGESFQKIVDTQGNDVSNLMNGLGSLNQMYSLLYTLLLLTLLLGLIGAAYTLYTYFAG
jgi:hypothetical protein